MPAAVSEGALSKRLRAVLEAAGGVFNTLADIGTDHGYIPIFAVKRGIARRAVACDLNAVPLKKAAENARLCGLAHIIETRAGYGLSALAPGEADCIVISGMGGLLMIDILREGAEAARAASRLVLQPQRDIPHVRRFLREAGFGICDEKIVLDSGKYYFIIICDKNAAEDNTPYSGPEYEFGRPLMARKDPLLAEYIRARLAKLNAIGAPVASQIELYMEALKCL